MADIRKIIIIFVVAILFSVLVFSIIEAVYPSPKYEDICKSRFFPSEAKARLEPNKCPDLKVPEIDVQACQDKKGNIDYTYDANGCAKAFSCNTCNNDWQLSQEDHSRYVFYISAFLALIAIFLGLYLPAKQNNLNEWIGTGFMLGGAFALFFGTAVSFQFLDRIVRPIVILLELVLVIFIAYRQIGNLREDKKVKEDRKRKRR